MKREVDLGSRKVTVVGTSHVSGESRDEVRETIREMEPDLVGVELDEDRYESLRDGSGWRDLDLAEAIRDGKGYLLFLNLMLSIYQRKLGLETGVEPGEEMMEAVEAAEGVGADVALVDRDISETFERLREELTFTEKLRLVSELFLGSEMEVELDELTEPGILDALVKQLEDDYPSISRVFLDERNDHMVEKLLEQEFDHAVLVVGAAHLEGVVERLEGEAEEVEPPGSNFPWMKVLRYGLPVAIAGLLSYGVYRFGLQLAVEGAGFWILANGILAMAGAILARSHVATWLVSFVAAPITSLDPALGAGMVASYFEGRFYPPTVGEMEDIVKLSEYRELWDNQAGRILLTFVFVTIGSALATFIGAGYIASLVL